MTISPDLGENVPITVVVKSARGGNVASKLNGVFLLRGREFRFKALAFGRIGGHNISLTIPKIALNEIIKMGLDPDVIYLKIQRLFFLYAAICVRDAFNRQTAGGL